MQAADKQRVDRRMTSGETEQKILTATAQLLDSGASLAGLSVNRIVEAAGVSRATFYLHFGDKRALVARLAASELQEFQRATGAFLADPAAERAELGAAIADLIELWRAHAGVLSSLIELAEYDAEAREDWRSVIGAIATSIAPALAGRNPELDPQIVRTSAEVLAWTGERTLHQLIGRECDDAQAARVAEALTEIVWRVLDPASAAAL